MHKIWICNVCEKKENESFLENVTEYEIINQPRAKWPTYKVLYLPYQKPQILFLEVNCKNILSSICNYKFRKEAG